MRITELFDNGQFVVTAEVGPPKGIDASHIVTEAKEYLSGARLKVVDPAGAAHRAKVDYVNLLTAGALLGILLSGIPVTVAELRKLR